MKSRNTIFGAILSALVCFAFSLQIRAACDSPDPGCPGANLAEGFLALQSLSGGVFNTGIGTYSLLSLTDGLYRLKPVTFRYKKEIDRTRSPVFGLIAEEVVQVNPNLVARNSQGQPESVRYDQVNAMLLNEFLKEHETVQQLKKEIAALTTTVKEQAAQIQKVSAQIELNKPAPQAIANK